MLTKANTLVKTGSIRNELNKIAIYIAKPVKETEHKHTHSTESK